MVRLKYVIAGCTEVKNFIRVEFTATGLGSKVTKIQLPSWRPGRYELGNFAKNVRKFTARADNGHTLPFQKTSKDCWEINNGNATSLTVSYEYYAADLNAGSTFYDGEMLYVNPVNCCVYIPELTDEKSELKIEIPSHWKIACALKKNGTTLYSCSYHELTDSPFICSATLVNFDYSVNNLVFHVWIQGAMNADIEKIRRDFRLFTLRQLEAFGEMPVNEYHFFIHAVPNTFYHGVEHQASSVNVLGPSYEITGERYVDLLGLCSHELYHSWNIKSIRPVEMMPYDYTKENYFRTGYVAEGVTTYMGDYFLFSSGVFSKAEYFNELNQQLQRHMDNFGRMNYSVSESSFDTWLDGYVPGVPGRKVSIYTEGCLLAFMSDILVRRNSGNKHSLHSVMKALYDDFYKKGKGYSEQDYKQLLEKFSGIPFDEFFNKYVNGTESYLPLLKNCLAYIGCEIKETVSSHFAEKKSGLKITEQGEKTIVSSVYPGSPAEKAGLCVNDIIISCNSVVLKNDLHKWLNSMQSENTEFIIGRGNRKISVEVNTDDREYFKLYSVTEKEYQAEEEKNNFVIWSTPVI